MNKKLTTAWTLVSIVLFVVLIIDHFIIKKQSFTVAIDEMWEALLPTVFLFLCSLELRKEQDKKKK